MQHQDVISLGVNDEGKESYTTRNQYVAECKLLQSVEQLSSRSGHVYSQNTKQLANAYQLNEEQRDALQYIAEGSDLSVLIGRPGVGKSYLLKPLKAHYEVYGCRVIGASLSGKVAKALESETGIKSYTIASLTYRLQKGTLTLNKNDVIVIDEAGMVDFANLSSVINYANDAQAKVVLVGDPDQLKPINKGEIFRGIAALTGYMELSQIRRQRDLGDRQASLMLSKGQIEQALTYYNNKRAIVFTDNVYDSATRLVIDWQGNIGKSSDIKENVMFAFSRAAVASLNIQARDFLKQKTIVGENEFTFERQNQEGNSCYGVNDHVVIQNAIPDLALKGGDNGRITEINDTHLFINIQGSVVSIPEGYQNFIKKMESNEIQLAQGERILFRKNDSSLNVRNGDMAFIESIDSKQFTAKLDSGELVTILKSYKHIDYGYATTVHKGQGMTVDNAHVLIDSKYWDRFLSFVAMTRHRNNVTIYADRHQHSDLKELTKTLSRSSTKDNVIDWPLDLAIRHGFSPDGLIGRALNHIAGVGHKIKNKYNYLVHYEAYARQKMIQERRDSKQQIRNVAKKVADYLDEQSHYLKLRNQVTKKSKELCVEASSLEEFKSLYSQSIVRDKKAHEIWTEHQNQLSDAPTLSSNKEDIQRASMRHERYLVIAEIAQHDSSKPFPEKLIQRSGSVDLEQDKIHVMQLASQFNKKSSELFQQVESAQKSYKKLVFNQLKKDHPHLATYDQLLTERGKVNGFKAEQLDKLILIKAREIINDKQLYNQLQHDLPKFIQSLSLKIKNHDLGLEK